MRNDGIQVACGDLKIKEFCRRQSSFCVEQIHVGRNTSVETNGRYLQCFSGFIFAQSRQLFAPLLGSHRGFSLANLSLQSTFARLSPWRTR